jgi:hypothetical protein
VLEAVGQGTAQLFPVEPDGVIVTRLVQEPGRLVCLVWLASGDLEPLLERYRRHRGLGGPRGRRRDAHPGPRRLAARAARVQARGRDPGEGIEVMGKGGITPPDSAYKKASMYPWAAEPGRQGDQGSPGPLQGRLEPGRIQPGLQTGAFQGAQNLLGQLGGQGQGGLNFASNVAQGGAMGAPGQGFLQGVYGQQTGGPAQQQLDRLATGAEGAIPGSLAGMQNTAAGGNMNVAQNPYLQARSRRATPT